MVGWTDHLSFNRKSVRTRSLYDDGGETAEAICLFPKAWCLSGSERESEKCEASINDGKREHAGWQGCMAFPQGKIMHQDMRPLELEGGASFLVRQFEQVVVKPVTLHYTFNQFQKPTVSAVFGEDTLVSGGEFRSKDVTHLLRDLLETQLNTHQAQVIADPDFSTNQEFRQMTRTSQSTSDAFDSFKKWVKTWWSS